MYNIFMYFTYHEHFIRFYSDFTSQKGQEVWGREKNQETFFFLWNFSLPSIFLPSSLSFIPQFHLIYNEKESLPPSLSPLILHHIWRGTKFSFLSVSSFIRLNNWNRGGIQIPPVINWTKKSYTQIPPIIFRFNKWKLNIQTHIWNHVIPFILW